MPQNSACARVRAIVFFERLNFSIHSIYLTPEFSKFFRLNLHIVQINLRRFAQGLQFIINLVKIFNFFLSKSSFVNQNIPSDKKKPLHRLRFSITESG